MSEPEPSQPQQQPVIVPPLSVVINVNNDPELDKPPHKCFEEGNDPLIGVLNETASCRACCPLQSFLQLAPDEFKSSVTPFGRRMLAVGDHYQVDIHKILLIKQPSISNEKIVDFFRHCFSRPSKSFRDDDRVEWLFAECTICLANCRFVRRPPCCSKSICQICWSSYLKNVGAINYDGIKPSSYNLLCYGCSKLVPYRQALVATEPTQLTLLRHDGSDLLAHCPVCLSEVNKQSFLLIKSNKFLTTTCDRCGHLFCGRCGADPHPKNSCYEVAHADAGLSLWMKEQHPMRPDFQNCRFCPNCNIPIAHSGGCPWLKCVCGLEFCFACGKAKQQWNGWHRQQIMKAVPFFTCPKMWKSTWKRVLVQSLFTIFFIFILLPVFITLLPLIIIVSILVTVVFMRIPNNRVVPR